MLDGILYKHVLYQTNITPAMEMVVLKISIAIQEINKFSAFMEPVLSKFQIRKPIHAESYP
jgi:hypothetical protein